VNARVSGHGDDDERMDDGQTMNEEEQEGFERWAVADVRSGRAERGRQYDGSSTCMAGCGETRKIARRQ